MLIIPIEPHTLEVIAAMNNGVKPVFNEIGHQSFIYHSPDRPTEVVPTALVGPVLSMREYKAMNIPVIFKDVEDETDPSLN